jgi:tRNA threonylcarbamoyladenosine biosynthesis protein TsaB
MMDELLADAGLSLGQLDGLAFGRGPGAFTGVRIGIGVAQGIGFSADLPLAPVSTLAALAQGVEGERILAALDARMGEIYWGAYERSAGGLVQLLGQECVCGPDKAPSVEGMAWVGAGSGWQTYAETLKQHYENKITYCYKNEYPRASSVARLGEVILEQGQGVSAEAALPVYLRDEVVWKKSR